MSTGNQVPNAGMTLVPRFQPKVAGIASAFELSLRFVAWTGQLHAEPTVSQICEQFGIHRATAYRWLAAWRAVCATRTRDQK